MSASFPIFCHIRDNMALQQLIHAKT